jgi:hypothetical protein
VNHSLAPKATTILHAYNLTRKSPQTSTNPRIRP